ncbi:ABC transporter ATP-binding protein [Microbacterium sp. zg.B48]|uniref:ABC transporter ATP-binding protein n=1 Tax=unclassified Microbacterium TaxID=2609290 RepID=UPI00214AAD31|nr:MULTISPECIES: ABC transporter ATP-binding protein [unclassified Microbacterium]MCR2764508.1 ABC transporter ATP-binding protein [Microbacterium sp. zg.B48]MCR2810900.1 ABC transporter ATP-binding protein [Microbacterium sp. zg.B185]WIM19697.1 ABC transporter ATP-binding protein [Microbacterium sp. zg-B185]
MSELRSSRGATPAAGAVAVRGLTVQRGSHTVFDGLELDIPRGQITGLLGPSGCGKTTLMRAIVGVQRIRAGTVSVLGHPAGTASQRRRVAYDTQAASVYDDLTIRQNLTYFARLIGAPRRDVDRVLAEVGLAAQRHQSVGSLSGGQENRVSLAVAMLGAPELIVLDEPTVGLDPVLRAELWTLFRRLADAGTTLIVSSHVMDEALRCDRLLLMRAGRIIADTTPDGLRAETGADDPDAAFLTLVERDAAAHPRAEAAARPLATQGHDLPEPDGRRRRRGPRGWGDGR